MNSAKQKTVLLLLCIICAVSMVHPICANASAGTVTGYQKITWGISTGRYYVNNIHAFCAQYNKSWPTVGTSVERIDVCSNEVIRKALYYGYNGPANQLGADERAHVLTAIAISDANIGERETGASSKYDEFYWNLVNHPEQYPAPPANFKTYMAITASEDLQNLAFYVLEDVPKVPEVPKKVYNLELVKYQTGTEIPIPGTVFEHVNPDGTTEQITTDKDGKIVLKDLQKGAHTIREISVMEGYVLNQKVYSFEVDDNTEETTRMTVYNDPKPYDFTVKKADTYGNQLQEAQFTLYSDKECKELLQQGKTDEKGELLFEGLTVGRNYYLKETKAPAGYKAVEKVYEIYANSIPAQKEFAFHVDGKAQGEDTSLTIINEVGFVLPKTGSSQSLAMVVSGVILCMISAKKELEKRRKNL